MEDKIWEYIVKRLTDNETPTSKSVVENWLAADAANELKFLAIKSLWDLTGEINLPKNELSFSLVEPDRVTEESSKLKVRKLSFWKYGIAASIAIVCIWGFYQFKPKASLAQAWIVKKTIPGQIMQLTLPDSSKIWLNAGSEISFAKNFTQHKLRTIKLRGEAYFEVKHDSLHPFVVHNDQFTTTVYGTSFNISAYPKDNLTAIRVNSGKVGVLKTGLIGKAPMMLLPKDQLVYNLHTQSFTKSNVAIKDVNSWTKGVLVFEQTPVLSVLAIIGRKFNVKIEADATKYQDCKLTARFQNQSLQEILQTLAQLLNIKSKQINQTIYIEGGTTCSK